MSIRITESQLRSIVRQEILRESLYDDWHGGTYGASGTPDPSEIDYTGSGLMMKNGVVEEMISPLGEAAQSRSYRGREYRASKGSLTSLRKSGGSKKKAVDAGSFDWAEEPYAAAMSAEIVGSGRPKSLGRKRK